MATTICVLFKNCQVSDCQEEHNSEQWRQLIQHLGPGLLAVVRQELRKIETWLADDQAEDVLQELYCRLLLGAGRRFHGHTASELWAYLRRMVRHLVLDRTRARMAEKRRLDRYPGASPWANAWPGLEVFRRLGPNPEEGCLMNERRRILKARCRRVAGGRRAKLRALSLALIQGFSSREIALALDGRVSPTQVDSMVHRLRRSMAREGLQLPRRLPGERPGWQPGKAMSSLC